MTFTYGSYSSDRRTLKIGGRETLQELIKIKKELDWWKGCNQRVFVSLYGKFFRDDKRLYLWKRQFKADGTVKFAELIVRPNKNCIQLLNYHWKITPEKMLSD